MFKVNHLALAAALSLSVDTVSSAGCYPAFSSGATYEAGSLSSFNSTNYQCVSSAYSQYCTGNQPPGAPGSLATVAWTSLGACSGTAAVPAPTAKPTPAKVTEGSGGCPQAFALGTEYEADERVSLNGIVYKCFGTVGAPNWCGTYSPEDESGAAAAAWTVVGSCSGVIPPTKAPSGAGGNPGCPKAWVSGTAYEALDQVQVDGMIYECDEIYYGHCPYREPGTVPGDESWTKKGKCEGTLAPTTAPSVPLDAPGCPAAFSASATYEGGDSVEVGGVVYECKAWPYSAFCSLTNFEPGSDNSDLGWIKKGGCDGTIAPTSSPTKPPAELYYDTGCHHPWLASDLDTYVPGTRVSYNNYVFECKSDIHYSKFCKQAAYSPSGIYWSLAWNKIAWCEGTMAPTSTPSAEPSLTPSAEPSLKPSASPSDEPSLKPSASPSDEPSLKPSAEPSLKPSAAPSDEPSLKPSAAPSDEPSLKPSAEPSLEPSLKPSAEPSLEPTLKPSSSPSTTQMPSDKPN